MRWSLTKDISATGATSEVTAENLNGSFLSEKVTPDVLKPPACRTGYPGDP